MCQFSKHAKHAGQRPVERKVWLAGRARFRGFTLSELMVAMAIVGIMAGTLAALTRAVRTSNDYTENVSLATQHARVVLERIQRAVSQGHASESFPGAFVFSHAVGAYTYPDTLVVWAPSGTAANPEGLPRFSEIVVFCPSATAANQLLEITAPSDNRTVPALTDAVLWGSALASLKTDPTSNKVLVTDLLRIARPTSGGSDRGVVQFVVELRPSAAEWASYRAGTTPFDELQWVQSIYGSRSGLRQTWVKSELQLMRGYNRVNDAARQTPLAYFGSASLYWDLHP